VAEDTWSGDWAWSLPLIVLTLVVHVFSLGVINTWVVRVLKAVSTRRNFITVFTFVMGITAVLATILHAFEAALWAWAYQLLGALPGFAGAMLYSLGAMTTYGHADLFLKAHWRLMGAIEALNGLLLFGLTTAFLYGHVQRIWLVEDVKLDPAAHTRGAAARRDG
jgi:hypothetical protein